MRNATRSKPQATKRLTYYEFFAGGGMARAGLGSEWDCLFANDFDHKKGDTYNQNWGGNALKIADVNSLTTKDVPGTADLAWASFPCQDLSLAGGGAGLKGNRSGTFWPFWQLIRDLSEERRSPKIVAVENVCGTLTSHRGDDFASICGAFDRLDYRVGAVVINAAQFLPHSRPRLFLIGVHESITIPLYLTSARFSLPWHTKTLLRAYENLSPSDKENWVWWSLRPPHSVNTRLVDFIDDNPTGVSWHSSEETDYLIQMMDTTNRQRLLQAQKTGKRVVGSLYRRTRPDHNGSKVQRAELRIDDVAGCLRTPAGGSSRQLILVIEGETIRSRLLSPREAARLMGLDESYKLPKRYNEAYHLIGDGVAVPVVRFLADQILEPILTNRNQIELAA